MPELTPEQIAAYEASPEFQARIGAHVQRLNAALVAATDPTPGPLAEALSEEPIRVGQFTLRPIVARDLILLKELDSPYHRALLNEARPEEDRKPVTFQHEELFEAFYLFAVPLREARAQLAKGRPAYRAAALETVADAMPVHQVAELAPAIERLFVRAFATRVAYGPKKAVEENFPTPPPTVSAGGSTSP